MDGAVENGEALVEVAAEGAGLFGYGLAPAPRVPVELGRFRAGFRPLLVG